MLFNASGSVVVARTFTPDALASGFAVAALYGLRFRSSRFVLVMLFLAVLTRPDAVLLAVGLVGYATFLAPPSRRWTRSAAIAVTAAFGITVALAHALSGSYDAQTVFYHAFQERVLRPSLFDPHVSLVDYRGVLLRAMSTLVLRGTRFALFVLLGVTGILAGRARDGAEPSSKSLLLVLLGAIGARFALFPSSDPRFFVASFVGIGATALTLLVPRVCASRRADARP